MTDRYERIREALEGLRERCAQEAERITGRRRAVAAMTNNEAVKPCEVAAAIRKIDVQQHYECAVREIKALRAEVERLNRILGRIVEGDGDSTLVIHMGADAFAAAREYLLRDQEEDHE